MTRREYALSIYQVAAIRGIAQRNKRALTATELAKLRNLTRRQDEYERSRPATAGRTLRAFVRFH